VTSVIVLGSPVAGLEKVILDGTWLPPKVESVK
jgi:hypothetical protein